MPYDSKSSKEAAGTSAPDALNLSSLQPIQSGQNIKIISRSRQSSFMPDFSGTATFNDENPTVMDAFPAEEKTMAPLNAPILSKTDHSEGQSQ